MVLLVERSGPTLTLGRHTMKKALVIGVLLIAGYVGVVWNRSDHSAENGAVSVDGNQSIETAFQNQASNVQVEGEGTVIRILSDDLKKPRHQRFILRLASGQTLLVAHNIDLAPRIENLAEGDRVAFNGEYEWNDKGGVIHWTHHDPGGQHKAGWLKHQGQVYQ
jgi:hypothetical protein